MGMNQTPASERVHIGFSESGTQENQALSTPLPGRIWQSFPM